MSQGKTLPSEVGLQNVKFDTALLLNRLRFYQDKYPNYKTKFQKRLETLGLSSEIIKTAKIGVSIISVIFKSILDLTKFKNAGRLFDYISTTNESLLIQEEHLLERAPDSLGEQFSNLASQSQRRLERVPREILQFFEATQEIDYLLSHHQRISNIGNRYINDQLDKFILQSVRTDFLARYTVYLTKNEIMIFNGNIYY